MRIPVEKAVKEGGKLLYGDIGKPLFIHRSLPFECSVSIFRSPSLRAYDPYPKFNFSIRYDLRFAYDCRCVARPEAGAKPAAAELHARTMRRFPKTMARLHEYELREQWEGPS